MSEPRLGGRTAIVTGGGTGIGRATAQRLAREGADVMLVGRRDETLRRAAATITDLGGNAWFHVADISQRDEADRVVDEAMAHHGRIDVVVNNAAVAAEKPFIEMSDESWQTVISTNLTGSFFVARAAARQMVAAKGGVILNNASIDAHGGERLHANYNASKAGLVAMTRTMAVDLAEHGIRVNAVSPGWTLVEAYEDWCDPELLAYLRSSFDRVPMRRLVRADEVAAVFAFLASDDASAITGQNIIVDCGLTANLYVQESWPAT